MAADDATVFAGCFGSFSFGNAFAVLVVVDVACTVVVEAAAVLLSCCVCCAREAESFFCCGTDVEAVAMGDTILDVTLSSDDVGDSNDCGAVLAAEIDAGCEDTDNCERDVN